MGDHGGAFSLSAQHAWEQFLMEAWKWRAQLYWPSVKSCESGFVDQAISTFGDVISELWHPAGKHRDRQLPFSSKYRFYLMKTLTTGYFFKRGVKKAVSQCCTGETFGPKPRAIIVKFHSFLRHKGVPLRRHFPVAINSLFPRRPNKLLWTLAFRSNCNPHEALELCPPPNLSNTFNSHPPFFSFFADSR